MTERAYFSVLRWRADPARDEARNVAVVMIDSEGAFGGVQAAPLSRISSRLAEQGMLDDIIRALTTRFGEGQEGTLGDLRELHASLTGSLVLTEPQIAAVGDDYKGALDALYKGFVRPRGGRSRGVTKGNMIDRVVDRFRALGVDVRRHEYYGDFLFDVLVGDPQEPHAVSAISFRHARKSWTETEHDAGHFLHASNTVGCPASAVIQRPEPEVSRPEAFDAHERIMRWYGSAKLPTFELEEFSELDDAVHQLAV